MGETDGSEASHKIRYVRQLRSGLWVARSNRGWSVAGKKKEHAIRRFAVLRDKYLAKEKHS